MKKKYLLLLFIPIGLFSQIDQPTSEIRQGSVNTHSSNKSTGTIEIPLSLEFNSGFNGFKTAKKDLERQRRLKRQEQELNNRGIFTKILVRKQRFNKNIEGFVYDFPQIDMDLGSFHTNSGVVYLVSYDFGKFDGDKVQVVVNGNRIHNNYLLTSKAKVLEIPLSIGINKIEVTALNEGELSPNTGYFAFYDDGNYLIKEGQWMLARGAKVLAVVVRDEK